MILISGRTARHHLLAHLLPVRPVDLTQSPGAYRPVDVTTGPGADDAMRRLVGRMLGSVPSVARGMSGDDHADIAAMPTEILELEMPLTARRLFTRALAAMAEGRRFTDAELAEARDRGAQRAQEGFPIELLVHNWMRGGGLLWTACVEAAEPGEEGGLVVIATELWQLVDQLIGAVTASYGATRDAIEHYERGPGQVVARLLLAGQDATPEAGQAGFELADGYDVLALAIDPTDDQQTDQAASLQVAGRRKVLRVFNAIDRHGPAGVLLALEPDSGHVLVPRTGSQVGVDRERCEAVRQLVQDAAGAPVTAACREAPTLAEVAAAARHATEILRVAQANQLGPGLHGIEAVALDYQVTRPGDAREALARVLEPLQEHPDLVMTIEVLLAKDGDRGRTARALGVHPNTINNRLARITGLLGLDPTTTRGVVVLSAALTARRIG